MENNEYWIRFWKVIGVTFSVLVLNITGCVIHRNERITEMVMEGIPPIEASCAVNSDTHGNCEMIGAINSVKGKQYD